MFQACWVSDCLADSFEVPARSLGISYDSISASSEIVVQLLSSNVKFFVKNNMDRCSDQGKSFTSACFLTQHRYLDKYKDQSVDAAVITYM